MNPDDSGLGTGSGSGSGAAGFVWEGEGEGEGTVGAGCIDGEDGCTRIGLDDAGALVLFLFQGSECVGSWS